MSDLVARVSTRPAECGTRWTIGRSGAARRRKQHHAFPPVHARSLTRDAGCCCYSVGRTTARSTSTQRAKPSAAAGRVWRVYGAPCQRRWKDADSVFGRALPTAHPRPTRAAERALPKDDRAEIRRGKQPATQPDPEEEEDDDDGKEAEVEEEEEGDTGDARLQVRTLLKRRRACWGIRTDLHTTWTGLGGARRDERRPWSPRYRGRCGDLPRPFRGPDPRPPCCVFSLSPCRY